MPGRRKDSRYLMSPPWSGAIHTFEDVIVERIGEGAIWVLSGSPANKEDELVFEMPNNGHSHGVAVRVVESRPVVIDERLQHRIRLQVVGADAAADSLDGEEL
jgi:hypothetical protein